jgi:glycosyltransferase involved in cell wall biosynthesis
MKLAIVSHKLCWPFAASPTGYATDGGFPFQIEAISELFDETAVVVPSETSVAESLAPIKGRRMTVVALSPPNGRGLSRKLGFPFWLIKNGKVIWHEVRKADAVHTPIPGDVGTIGMVMAMITRKPLFVRHCGNWFVQRTAAERFWKWSMEYFAGGRNVMLATGGGTDGPSRKNANVKWIFSTSLRRAQMALGKPCVLPEDGRIRLITASRLEERKGTDVIIESMPGILESFPNARLDVVGDGSLMSKLKQRTVELGVSQNVTFHGKLEHSTLLKLFCEGHLFCYPTAASEGFPKVVLEALASGMPVITTRVSVLPQLIGNGCGILLDSASPEELSKAVINVCSNKTQFGKMSKRAIEVSKQYCLEDWRDLIGNTLGDAWGVNSLSLEAKTVD